MDKESEGVCRGGIGGLGVVLLPVERGSERGEEV